MMGQVDFGGQQTTKNKKRKRKIVYIFVHKYMNIIYRAEEAEI